MAPGFEPAVNLDRGMLDPDQGFEAARILNLDRSFTAIKRYTGHVVSSLGWGAHSLAPLSFRGATYSGVFALLLMATGAALAASATRHRRRATNDNRSWGGIAGSAA